MNAPNFSELPQEDQVRIDAYLDGTMEPAESEILQDRMMKNPAQRAVIRRGLALADVGLMLFHSAEFAHGY